MAQLVHITTLFLLIILWASPGCRGQRDGGCVFQENAEKQISVEEDTPPGTELFVVRAFPRRLFNIQAVDGSRADGFFTFREVDRRHVAIVLAKSLEHLADQSKPTHFIRFRLACHGRDSTTSYLPVTVFIQDINDNPPVFQSQGYNVTIDENTPPGLTIYRGIQALDIDKPNTPNSDVTYSIVSGNDDRKFSIEGNQKAVVVLRKPLDFEQGDSLFNLTILAKDRGIPPLSSETSLVVRVRDIDDSPPRFTRPVYKIAIPEDLPADSKHQHQDRLVKFLPPIKAIDQDHEVNAELIYEITSGNDMQYFKIDPNTAQLYLTKHLDGEMLDSNKFFLEVMARQKDSELKTASATLEITVEDLNDNKPEFEVEQYNMTVIENLPVGFRIMQFSATDRDTGVNAKFSYRLDDPSGAFGLEGDGNLVLARPELFDREKMEKVVVKVLAIEETPTVLADKEHTSVKVEIHLLDTNDNSPAFLPSNVYVFKVDDKAKIGDIIGEVKAVDADQAENALISYTIKNATEDLPVSINDKTGQLILTSLETNKRKLSLFVNAADQPVNEAETRFALAVVELQFPGGAEVPYFEGAPYEWWVEGGKKDIEAGQLVGVVRAANLQPEKTVYGLQHNYNGDVPFEVHQSTGVLTISSGTLKELKSSYNLEVVARDDGQQISAPVTIHITKDAQDDASIEQFTDKLNDLPETLEYSVLENVEGALVANLSLLHENKRKGAVSEHLIANHEAREVFLLSDAGLLFTSKPLDREERDSYMVTIVLGRKGIIRGKQAVQVKVRVIDENDNSPSFEQHIYQGHIPENSNVGTKVLLARKITASDPDISDKDGVKLELHGKDSDKFKFDPSNGDVYLATDGLDREEKEVYYLRLKATDSAGNIGEGQLVIHVTDRNDHQPKFIKLQVLDSRLVSVAADKVWVGSGVGAPVLDMSETVPPGTRIARVLAEDLDNNRNSQLLYSLLSEEGVFQEARPGVPAKKRFSVDPNSGDIIVSRQVEALTTYIVNISAQDEGGLSTITQIILRINDTNNNRPVFDKSYYHFKVLEGDYRRADIGTIHAEDGDFFDAGRVSYEVLADGQNVPFYINATTGMLSISGNLDRETTPSYQFEVIASDHGSKSLDSRVNVTVTILDQNDNQPLFYGYDRLQEHNGVHTIPVYSTHINSYMVEMGVKVAKVFANDSDEVSTGNGAIEFKILEHSNVFYIDSATGEVTTLVPISQPYNITILAVDQGKPPKSASAVINLTLKDLPGGGGGGEPQEQPRSTIERVKNPLIFSPFESGNNLETNKREKQRGDASHSSADTPDQPHILPVGQMFKKDVYDVEVYENIQAPLEILDLGKEIVGVDEGVGEDEDSGLPVHFRIVGSNYGLFSITEQTGKLYLTQKPDRELRDKYVLRVKASTTKSSKKVPLFFYTLYIEGEGGEGAGEGEVIVRVNVLDVNDHNPVFRSDRGELIASVPTTAEYGHHVTKIQVSDADAGINSKIRYSFVERDGDGSDRFQINRDTGEVISTASFLGQAGASFQLVVKATDKDGRGLSATKTLLVDVVSPLQEVSLLVSKSPSQLAAIHKNLTSSISKLAGLSIRKSSLRPSGQATELRVYGLEGGAVLDGKELAVRLTSLPLADYDIQSIQLSRTEDEAALGSVEVAVLTMACLVFLGAFIAVLCICCIKMKRSQKHYPAPLAIPLPNYSSYEGKELERQASQRFGTIPRVTKIHDPRSESHDSHEKRPGGYIVDSSEDDAYLSQSIHHRPGDSHSHSHHSTHSTPSHRKSVRSTKGAKSSGESSRSRDSGIDDNIRDCCSCRQSSVSSRDSYGWPGGPAVAVGRPVEASCGVRCSRCCSCAVGKIRRHRSSSPARRACSLKTRCSSHRSLPRHAHSHHDLRDETETESEMSDSGPAMARGGSAHSSRRALYTAELFSNSLTPAHSEARLSSNEMRLATTTANRGHSWRGDHHPFEKQKPSSYHHTDSHISLPNFQKERERDSHHEGGAGMARTSVRKSNIKSQPSGVRISGHGVNHQARNNAMI